MLANSFQLQWLICFKAIHSFCDLTKEQDFPTCEKPTMSKVVKYVMNIEVLAWLI